MVIFQPYLAKWHLVPVGTPIITHSSWLMPVRFCGLPAKSEQKAMLKVAVAQEEQRGNLLMCWWDGEGAARVLAHDKQAVLLEYAQNDITLRKMSISGQDAEACRIICNSVATLHTFRGKPLPQLILLKQWFRNLQPAAQKYGGMFALSATIAEELLLHPQDTVVLHGDIHHDNILNFGERGWLAIDPKGLLGERGFDYANIFCNPDEDIALNHDVFTHRLEIISAMAKLEKQRLLKWIVAWAGLSASWLLDEEQYSLAKVKIAVAKMAAERLGLLSSR